MITMTTTELQDLQQQVRERTKKIRDDKEAASELKSLKEVLEFAGDDTDYQCAILKAWLEMTRRYE